MLLVAERELWTGFGAKLRRFREEAGMTLGDIGDAAGISKQAVAKLEAGGTPSWETAVKLARALERSLDDFLTDGTDEGGAG
jgi:transcriptional regulator with XRE-family HTH domain